MTTERLNTIREILADNYVIEDDDRIKFIEVKGDRDCDCRFFVFEVYHKRCRNAYAVTELYIDVVRELIHLDLSSYYRV